MARQALTEDQRWLLRSIGGWAMRDCLLGPEGVADLMSRCSSSTGHRIDGAPEWLANGYTCGRGKIVCPWWTTDIGRPPVKSVTITTAQINRYARSLPQDVTDELRAVRRAFNAENIGRDWCRCGREAECHRGNEGDPTYGGMYHPTDEEVDNHYRELRRIQAWQDRVLDRALGFQTVEHDLYNPESEPAGHCATSLDEFSIGQHVKVVLGPGAMKSGVVADITSNEVEVQFGDGASGLYRPYEVMPGLLPVGQLELFTVTS